LVAASDGSTELGGNYFDERDRWHVERRLVLAHGFDSRLPPQPRLDVTTHVRSERPPAGGRPLFQADHRGSLGLLPDHFAYPLAAPDPVPLCADRVSVLVGQVARFSPVGMISTLRAAAIESAKQALPAAGAAHSHGHVVPGFLRTYSAFVESGPHLGVNRLKWGIPAKWAAPLAATEPGRWPLDRA